MIFKRPLPLVFLILAQASAFAQQGRWQDNWDAKEAMIPMRDGVKLHTVFYVPKNKKGPFPILLERTPYGAGSAHGGPQRATKPIVEAGYILAWQDVRGKGGSEGLFENVRPILPKKSPGTDETTDTYDTVDYLIKNVPNNSHRVGLWGISYPGFYAGVAGVRNHPAIKAISPQAPVNDWFMGDDVHHRGALFLQETFDFLPFFDVPPGVRLSIDRAGKSAYNFYLEAGALSNYNEKFLKGQVPYWNELLANDTYNQYWKDRALWRSFRDVDCAVLTVGGEFDKEDMWGALSLFRAGEKTPSGKQNFLCFGPWSHGQWANSGSSSLGDLDFGQRTSEWYQKNVELPFFERYLRGRTDGPAVPKATVFETGLNKWHTFSQWPPKTKSMSLFLDGSKALAWKKPDLGGMVDYAYDPAAPTPYVSDFENSRLTPGDWLARKQNFLADRKDQQTFTLAPQSEDLTIAGPIRAEMWIKTTGTDADLVVQLLDVYPEDTKDKDRAGNSLGGAQMMVRGEIMRCKFRNSWENPSPIVPGQPTLVKFDLNDVLHTFRKGHQIAVRVQSAWFPVADRNPNKFVSESLAKDSDFMPATVSVLCGGKYPSQLHLGKLE